MEKVTFYADETKRHRLHHEIVPNTEGSEIWVQFSGIKRENWITKKIRQIKTYLFGRRDVWVDYQGATKE